MHPPSFLAASAALVLLVAPTPSAQTPAVQTTVEAASEREGAHHVVVNGVRLWYRVAGTGAPSAPPVVFLHGGPGQGSAHADALAGPHLEPTLRMIYLDQRGSGHSERPWTGDYALATLVADIEGLRQHLGVPQIALVGHSFGALLALEYAAAHPERVSHVVFVAGLWDLALQCELRLATLAELRPEAHARVMASHPDGPREGCTLESEAFTSREDREAYSLETMFPDPALAERMRRTEEAHGIRNTGELGRALFGGGAMAGYRFEATDRLTMPVLVVAGRHDGAARPEGLRVLAERLPRARFVEYDASGHFVYLDEPERFARDLTAFLAEPAGR